MAAADYMFPMYHDSFQRVARLNQESNSAQGFRVVLQSVISTESQLGLLVKQTLSLPSQLLIAGDDNAIGAIEEWGALVNTLTMSAMTSLQTFQHMIAIFGSTAMKESKQGARLFDQLAPTSSEWSPQPPATVSQKNTSQSHVDQLRSNEPKMDSEMRPAMSHSFGRVDASMSNKQVSPNQEACQGLPACNGVFGSDETEATQRSEIQDGTELLEFMKKRPRHLIEGEKADCWEWRKYGQKALKDKGMSRSYYRCAGKGVNKEPCPTKKIIDFYDNGSLVSVQITSEPHSHPPPWRKLRNIVAMDPQHAPSDSNATVTSVLPLEQARPDGLESCQKDFGKRQKFDSVDCKTDSKLHVKADKCTKETNGKLHSKSENDAEETENTVSKHSLMDNDI